MVLAIVVSRIRLYGLREKEKKGGRRMTFFSVFSFFFFIFKEVCCESVESRYSSPVLPPSLPLPTFPPSSPSPPPPSPLTPSPRPAHFSSPISPAPSFSLPFSLTPLTPLRDPPPPPPLSDPLPSGRCNWSGKGRGGEGVVGKE